MSSRGSYRALIKRRDDISSAQEGAESVQSVLDQASDYVPHNRENLFRAFDNSLEKASSQLIMSREALAGKQPDYLVFDKNIRILFEVVTNISSQAQRAKGARDKLRSDIAQAQHQAATQISIAKTAISSAGSDCSLSAKSHLRNAQTQAANAESARDLVQQLALYNAAISGAKEARRRADSDREEAERRERQRREDEERRRRNSYSAGGVGFGIGSSLWWFFKRQWWIL